MIHKLLAVDESQRDRILSGSKSAQVFIRDFCNRQFRVGDKVIPDWPLNNPIGVYEVVEVRECPLLEVAVEEAVANGYATWGLMESDLRRAYPGLQVYTMVIVVRWKPLPATVKEAGGKCEECDERDQT